MTYGETKAFVSSFLRGDNSNPQIDNTHFKMAIMEIETLCEPDLLRAEYTGSETDVFRVLHDAEYLKTPQIPDTVDDNDPLPIDQQLGMAVVFFICSYLSNKFKDKYEIKAEKVISVYVSNIVSLDAQ